MELMEESEPKLALSDPGDPLGSIGIHMPIDSSRGDRGANLAGLGYDAPIWEYREGDVTREPGKVGVPRWLVCVSTSPTTFHRI